MTSTNMVEKSKPGRPTKRIQKHLDAIDSQRRKWSDITPDEKENDLNDLTESENDVGEQTESEITASMLPESMIEDATISTSPTEERSSITRMRDQPRNPCFLQIYCHKNVESDHDHLQEDIWDEL